MYEISSTSVIYGGKYLLKSALDCLELYHYIDI